MLVVEPAETVFATVVLGPRNVSYGAWNQGELRQLNADVDRPTLGVSAAARDCEHCGLANSATAPALRRCSAVEAAPSDSPTRRGCFHGPLLSSPGTRLCLKAWNLPTLAPGSALRSPDLSTPTLQVSGQVSTKSVPCRACKYLGRHLAAEPARRLIRVAQERPTQNNH